MDKTTRPNLPETLSNLQRVSEQATSEEVVDAFGDKAFRDMKEAKANAIPEISPKNRRIMTIVSAMGDNLTFEELARLSKKRHDHPRYDDLFERIMKLKRWGIASDKIAIASDGRPVWRMKLDDKGWGILHDKRLSFDHIGLRIEDDYMTGDGNRFQSQGPKVYLSVTSGERLAKKDGATIKAQLNISRTKDDLAFVDLTPRIVELVNKLGVKYGRVTLTPAQQGSAIKINEKEEQLEQDYQNHLMADVPAELYHIGQPEQGAQHLKDLISDSYETIPIIESRLGIGTWQRVFLVDNTGSRNLKVKVEIQVGTPDATHIFNRGKRPKDPDDLVHFYDLTLEAQEFLKTTGIRDGEVTFFSMHTTAGLKVISPFNQDAFERDLNLFAPRTLKVGDYRHNNIYLRRPPIASDENPNANSHLQALLINASATLPIKDGVIALDQLKQVYLLELDGPRARSNVVAVFYEKN